MCSYESWDSFFWVVRVTQRRYVIIENVCGLLKHPDFGEIVRFFRFCGYILLSQRVCDAAPIGCVARPRLIMIFRNCADWVEGRQPNATVPSIASLSPPIPCCQAGSLWEPIPPCLLTQLLGQRGYLPVWLRGSFKSVWSLRQVDRQRPLPSITAASLESKP